MLALALGLGAAGCGKDHQAGVDIETILTSTCRVATDQRKSFMSRMVEFPTEIQVDSTFSNDQQSAIKDAADRWNRVGRDLMGQDFFSVRVTGLSDFVRSTDPHDCAKSYGTKRSFAIVREKAMAHWKGLGLNEVVPGATVRCFASTEVAQQIVWLYPELISAEQFGSVALHELGHTVGLDHSCLEAGANEKYAACQGLSTGHPYRQAVMYPSLHVTAPGSSSLMDQPEIKNDLRSNDILRAQCLYDSRGR